VLLFLQIWWEVISEEKTDCDYDKRNICVIICDTDIS
jgi:hypothetical protein